MRYLVIVLLLAGCGLSPEYMASREREEMSRYMASCDSLGYQRGSTQHQECSIRLYEAANAAVRVR